MGANVSENVENIQPKVIEIIAEQMQIPKEQITMETHFVNDLGADSLDVVEMVMELEEAFDITIPDEDSDKIQTVGDAIKYIQEHR
jgi:acyl carrier protein